MDGLVLLQRGVVGEHLEAGLTDVAGRFRVALPMLLEEGEGGGHKLAGGAGQAGGVGLVVAEQEGDLGVLVVTLGTLVGLAHQMLLLHNTTSNTNIN